jgi:translation initiation factor IF-2
MLSIKLHEATKEFKISNKLAMFFLEKLDIPVKSHSSVITMEQLELLREFSGDKGNYSHIREEFDRLEKEKKKKKTATIEQQVKKEEIREIEIKPGVLPKEEKPQPQKPEKGKEPIPGPKPEHETKPEFKPRPEHETKPEFKPRPEHETKPEFKPRPEHETKPEFKPKPEHETKPEFKSKFESAPGPGAQPEPQVEPSPPPPRHKKEPPFERDKEKRKKPAPKGKQKEKLGEVGAHEPHRERPSRPRKKDKARFKEREKARVKEEREAPKAAPKEKVKEKPPVVERKRQKPKTHDLPELIQTSNYCSVKELAEKLKIRLKDIEEKTRVLKKEYLPNQFLEKEEIKEICSALGVEVDIVSYEDGIFFNHIEALKALPSPRAPVVTVMGHVDHGKTTLLDTLRHTRVADGEAGGITQKIGAYKLSYNNSDIIFIDTPGHEAFTNIRARGAKVTDIVVLVVAANDGVQPQTIEAINHAQAAGVPIVVAINKIDIEGANPNKVKEQLTRHEIVVEDWGGDVVCVEISAKQNKNLEALLEMLSLVAEMLELKAYKNIPARGTIIESHLDPQLGPMGTVLIQHGQLKRGDFFICGNSVGKVKSLFDDQARVLQQAEVPLPVEIMGFAHVPEAGELFQVTDDIEKAKKVVELRKLKDKENRKDEAFTEKKLSLQNLFQKLEENKIKVIPMIMKTDNFSSGEVLEQILSKLSQEQLKINIIHKGIGHITESDILLASTSGAMVVGFNVKTPPNVLALAKREKVEIKLYNVIYHLIEEMEKAIKGEIKPVYIENYVGKVDVLQTFKISKVGIIAGCLVQEGKVTHNSKVKVFRKNNLMFAGEIENLKRVKNDVSEVLAGTECGIRVKNFNNIEVGDVIEIYEVKLKE